MENFTVQLKHIDYRLWWVNDMGSFCLYFQVKRMDEAFRRVEETNKHKCKFVRDKAKIMVAICSDQFPEIQFNHKFAFGETELFVYLQGSLHLEDLDSSFIDCTDISQEERDLVVEAIHFAIKDWDENWIGWEDGVCPMEETGPLGQTPVDGTSDCSGLHRSESICHLRYKLWNVENIVLFKILEQNTFPDSEFRSKNNSLVYAYDYACFSWSPEMSRCLIGLPNKKGMMIQDRTYICHRTISTQEAELAVDVANQALFEWADSLGNGFVITEIV